MVPLLLYLTMANGPPVNYQKAIASVRQLADATRVSQDIALSRKITPPAAQQAVASKYGMKGYIDTLSTIAGGNPDRLVLTPTSAEQLVGAAQTLRTTSGPTGEQLTIEDYVPSYPDQNLQNLARGSLAHEYGHLFKDLEGSWYDQGPIMSAFMARNPIASGIYGPAKSEEAFADLFSDAVGRKTGSNRQVKYQQTSQFDTPESRRMLDSLVGARLRSLAKLPF
jgi:hypothetical protein